MYKVKSYIRFQILLKKKKKRLTQRKINFESKLSISTTLRIYSQVYFVGNAILLSDNETFYNRFLNDRKMSPGL